MKRFALHEWRDFVSGRHRECRVDGVSRYLRRNLREQDLVLAYVVGLQRWTGILTVSRLVSRTHAASEEAGSVAILTPFTVLRTGAAVPMEELEGRVSFYRTAADSRGYRGVLRRRNPARLDSDDGRVIMRLIEERAPFKTRVAKLGV